MTESRKHVSYYSTPHLHIEFVILRNHVRKLNTARLLPYKRLLGICRWMGSHFHVWIDYNRIAFSMEFLEWRRTFSDFGVGKFFTFTPG